MLQIKMINKYNNKVKINLVITGLYFLDFLIWTIWILRSQKRFWLQWIRPKFKLDSVWFMSDALATKQKFVSTKIKVKINIIKVIIKFKLLEKFLFPNFCKVKKIKFTL